VKSYTDIVILSTFSPGTQDTASHDHGTLQLKKSLAGVSNPVQIALIL
jgi:hypothetical protein